MEEAFKNGVQNRQKGFSLKHPGIVLRLILYQAREGFPDLGAHDEG